MYVEVTPRQFSVRVYEKEGDTDYLASAQFFSYGDRVSFYSICGNRFYEAMLLILDKLEKDNINKIDGYVSPAHSRLLRMMLKKYKADWSISEDGPGKMFGHNLIWVTLTKNNNK